VAQAHPGSGAAPLQLGLQREQLTSRQGLTCFCSEAVLCERSPATTRSLGGSDVRRQRAQQYAKLERSLLQHQWNATLTKCSLTTAHSHFCNLSAGLRPGAEVGSGSMGHRTAAGRQGARGAHQLG
jgi:hypothetical protein